MKMRKSITPNQIKETNRTLIYQYIYKKKKVSQQDICLLYTSPSPRDA